MLQTQKDRRPFSVRGWGLVAALAVAVSLPLAAVGTAPPSVPTDAAIVISESVSAPARQAVDDTASAPSPGAVAATTPTVPMRAARQVQGIQILWPRAGPDRRCHAWCDGDRDGCGCGEAVRGHDQCAGLVRVPPAAGSL